MTIGRGVSTGFLHKIEQHLLHATLAVGLDWCGGLDESKATAGHRLCVQELELLLASVEVISPSRQEVHDLVGNAPSLRYLSEMNEGVLRNLENSCTNFTSAGTPFSAS